MAAMNPTPGFAPFGNDAISNDRSRPHPAPLVGGGAVRSSYEATRDLLAAGGFASGDCSEYDAIIRAGLARLAETVF